MILCKNMKAMVCSTNGDTNFFDIDIGVLQRNTYASYLLIICQDYKLQTSTNLKKKIASH